MKGDSEKFEKWGTLPYLSAIAGTIVDGAQHIQSKSQGHISTIVIPTGDVKATDFERLDEALLTTLVQAGRSASQKFFDSELAHIGVRPLPSAVCSDREDLYNKITQHLDDGLQELLISEYDTYFLYSIFPSIFIWRMRGVKVRVLLPKTEKKKEHGKYRRLLLRKLGVQVHESDDAPALGYIINGHTPDKSSAYIIHDGDKQGIKAIIYSGAIHSAMINSLHKEIISKFPEFSFEDFKPTMAAGSVDELLGKLKDVAQYGKSGVTLSLESVPLGKLDSLGRFVHEYKYRQHRHWLPEFDKSGLNHFQSAQVSFSDSQHSIITPPVVEEIGGRYVLIEGSTRAVLLRDMGVKEMTCIVVKNTQDPLPGERYPFNLVRVMGTGAKTQDRYKDFDYNHFRAIERSTHPLESLQE